MFWSWKCYFIDFFKMFIIHVNVVIQFETVIDRAIIFKIWIICVDVLFWNVRCVVDVYDTIRFAYTFNLVVELITT